MRGALKHFLIYFRVTRSYAPLLMCFGSLIGMILSMGMVVDVLETLVPLVSLYFLTAASFVFNDIFDIEVDRANRINRPLVTGEMGVRSAWVLWAMLTFFGLTLLVLLKNVWASLLLLGSYVVSLIYTLRIKRYGVLGNAAVSLLVSLSLVYGALSVRGFFSPSMLSLVFLAFLLNLAREVIQGIADVEGDALKDFKSVARKYEVRVAKFLGITLIALMVASAPIIIKVGGSELFKNDAILYGYALVSAGFSVVLYRLWIARGEREVRLVLKAINALTTFLLLLIFISVVM